MPITYQSWTADPAVATVSATDKIPLVQSATDLHVTPALLHTFHEAQDWTPTGTWDFSGATVSGVSATVADDSITLAKLQNIAQGNIFSRTTTGTGDPELVSLSALLDLLGTPADGDVIYRTGGSWALLAKGTDGHVLTLASGLPSWAAPGGGGGGSAPTYKRTTSDFSTTSTAFVDVTGLTFSVAANTDYVLEVIGLASSNAVTDALEIGVNGPASPSSVIGHMNIPGNSVAIGYHYTVSSYDEDIVGLNGPGATGNLGFRAVFIVRNGANSGTLAFRLRSEVGNTTTVKSGAVGILTEITAA